MIRLNLHFFLLLLLLLLLRLLEERKSGRGTVLESSADYLRADAEGSRQGLLTPFVGWSDRGTASAGCLMG